jgi:hypothetical protein
MITALHQMRGNLRYQKCSFLVGYPVSSSLVTCLIPFTCQVVSRKMLANWLMKTKLVSLPRGS